MKITIRHLQGEEMLDALYTLSSYSLHSSPPFRDRKEWEAVVRERQGINCHALFEDDMPVSIAVSTPMTQNMRGKLFPASGVWGGVNLASGAAKRLLQAGHGEPALRRARFWEGLLESLSVP